MKPVNLLISLPFLVAILLTIALFVQVRTELHAFEEHHTHLSQQAISNLKYQMETFLDEKRRAAQIYAKAIAPKLADLYDNPYDDEIIDFISNDLKDTFPHFLAFTATTEDGKRLVDPFLEEMGEVCQMDIHTYLISGTYEIFVHPGPTKAHFDIISRWQYADKSGAFLISFSPEMLMSMVSNSQSSGHNLFLLRDEGEGLIEISAEGLRRNLQREVFLKPDERKHISGQAYIDNSAWHIVDILDSGLLVNKRWQQWLHVLIIMTLYIIVAFALTWFALRESRKAATHMSNLVEARLQAEQSSLSKSHFVSNMSHEFRTPLNAIIGFSDLILMLQDYSDKKTEAHIRKIHQAGVHMLHLVDDILQLADIDIDNIDLTLLKTELRPIIQDMANLMEREAALNSVRLISPDDVNYCVLADESQLRQVFRNLLSNAIKFNHPKGTVEIFIEDKRDQRLRINIKDTGMGIPESLQYRVFQPFERFNAHEHAIEGTGIGLVICKKLIEKMDGKIGFTSTQGTGSNFWFELKLYTGE